MRFYKLKRFAVAAAVWLVFIAFVYLVFSEDEHVSNNNEYSDRKDATEESQDTPDVGDEEPMKHFAMEGVSEPEDQRALIKAVSDSIGQ